MGTAWPGHQVVLGGASKIDCNDGDGSVHPGGQEVCGDGIDNDCNGRADEGCLAGGKSTAYNYNAFSQLLAVGKQVTCTSSDVDCDGKANSVDNCPSVYNPGQEQSDGGDILAGGPIALWRFEDAAGSTQAADSMGGYAGTLQGGASFAASGQETLRKSLSLNGTTAFVTVPESLSTRLGNKITVEAWVYSNVVSSSSRRGIVSEVLDFNSGDSGVQFDLYLDGTANNLGAGISFGSFWSNISDSAPFPLSQWVHVAGTYDGSKIRLYRAGVQVAESSAINQPLPAGKGGWRIGAPEYYLGASNLWNGKLDDVAIYNRALSSQEIAQHAAQPYGDWQGDKCDACPTNLDPSCVPATCVDQDGDGYGLPGASSCSAGQPAKFDCDDTDPQIHPGATELVGDGRDNDCDGITDGNIAEATRFSWDGNGNLVGDGVATYTWDARDRLVSNGYGYDTGNLRVKMGEQTVLLDGIEEAREYGAEVKRYDHDPSRVDGLLAQKTGVGKGYFVTDALGSVYAVVDGSGAVVSKYGYDVYGARTTTSEGMATGWGFTGRRHDSSTAMYYRQREYEPSLGIFFSEDPVARGPFGSQLETRITNGNYAIVSPAETRGHYIYAEHNPGSAIDPSGELSFKTGGFVSFRSRYAPPATYSTVPEEHLDRLEEAARRVGYAIINGDCAYAFAQSAAGSTSCRGDNGRAGQAIYNRIEIWRVTSAGHGNFGRSEVGTSPPIIGYTRFAYRIGIYALAGTAMLHEMAHHLVGPGHESHGLLNPYITQYRCGFPPISAADL